jgi:hypothetical protein
VVFGENIYINLIMLFIMKKVLFLLIIGALVTLNVNAQSKLQKISPKEMKSFVGNSFIARGESQTSATTSNLFSLPNGKTITKSTQSTILFSWDVEHDPIGPDDYYVVDGDQLITHWWGEKRSWSVYYEGFQTGGGIIEVTDNMVLVANSWFDDGVGADNWLACPNVEIPLGGVYEFAWDAKSLQGAPYDETYEIKIIIGAKYDELEESAASEPQLSELLATNSEQLYVTNPTEVGGVGQTLVSRKVDIPVEYAGKEVRILIHHNTPWDSNALMVDNIELRSKEDYAISASISNLPQIVFYKEPTWLNPHSTYLSKPSVTLKNIGMAAVTGVVATIEQLDYYWNVADTKDIDFGTIAYEESKTMATAEDFTFDTKEFGYSFLLTVIPDQESAAIQLETPAYAIALTPNTFSQNNGDLDRFLYVTDEIVVKYTGMEYTFPVKVNLKSVTFVLGGTDMSSTNVHVFDVETGNEVAVTAEIPVSANPNGAFYTATITGGGVNLVAGKAYALMVREDPSKRISIGTATSKSTNGKFAISNDDGTLDWYSSAYSIMVDANVEASGSKIEDLAAQTLTKAVRQGNDFVLSYPASATSVSAYNVDGQKVAEYKLNTSGTYTMPAANLANGVYVLKFNGSNTVVKILK